MKILVSCFAIFFNISFLLKYFLTKISLQPAILVEFGILAMKFADLLRAFFSLLLYKNNLC